METTDTSAPALWGISDIARYYGRSERTARRIVRRPGFPAPVPTDPHRWVAWQVVAHAEGRDHSTPPELLEPAREPVRRVKRRRAVAA